MVASPSLAVGRRKGRVRTTEPMRWVCLSMHLSPEVLISCVFQGVLDARTSKKILDLAKDQKAEIEEDDWEDEESEVEDEPING